MYVCIMYVHIYFLRIYVQRGRIILKWTLQKQKHVACIHLTQDKDKWRAVMKKVMNFGVPRNVGNGLLSRGTLSLSRRTLLSEQWLLD